MEYVLTLVSRNPLSERTIDTVCYKLAQEGALIGQVDPLSLEHAVDIYLSEVNPVKIRRQFHVFLETLKVDMHYQPVGKRRKKLLAMILEHCAIREDPMEMVLNASGLGEAYKSTYSAMQNGKESIAAGMAKWGELLKDKPYDPVPQALKKLTLSPGLMSLVKTMKAHDAKTAIMTGGLKAFADYVKDKTGFDYAYGNDFYGLHNRFVGTGIYKISGARAFEDIMMSLASSLGVQMWETASVGSDRFATLMLKTSGLGVLYRSDIPAGIDADIRIKYTDLKTLLYYQGYHDDEIVE